MISTYKFLRVVILVRTLGNGPDNLFPIKELHIQLTTRTFSVTLKSQVVYLKRRNWRDYAEKSKGCLAESSYISTKRMVLHCGGIEPVMMLRLRSLFKMQDKVSGLHHSLRIINEWYGNIMQRKESRLQKTEVWLSYKCVRYWSLENIGERLPDRFWPFKNLFI